MEGRGYVTAYIALGANLGAAENTMTAAVQAIGKLPLTQTVKASGLYKTAPLNTDTRVTASASGDDYLNAVVEVQTGLTAPALLAELKHIENNAGRTRPYRNAPRTLDLDILLYGTGFMDSVLLTVPHPRMLQRAFVLVPLSEIAPALVTAAQLEAVAPQAIQWIPSLHFGKN